MTAFDLNRHAAVALLPLAAGPDFIKFDSGLGCIYVACYSGAISISFIKIIHTTTERWKTFPFSTRFIALP